MTDITTFTASLGALKTATEIAKYFRTTGQSLEKAELKNKLVDLLDALADARKNVCNS